MATRWRHTLLLGALGVALVAAFPDQRERRQAEEAGPGPGPGATEEDEAGAGADPLGLPANASALLPGGGPAEDSFSCAGRGYGYYADPANACRVFHVCLPLRLPSAPADAPPLEHRFSFICPEQTLFNQEAFTCTRPEDSIPCEESPEWYHLNERLGQTDSPLAAVPAPAGAGDEAGEAEASPNAL